VGGRGVTVQRQDRRSGREQTETRRERGERSDARRGQGRAESTDVECRDDFQFVVYSIPPFFGMDCTEKERGQ
jgi:hypothetical protein